MTFISDKIKEFREKFGICPPCGSEWEMGIVGSWKSIEFFLTTALEEARQEERERKSKQFNSFPEEIQALREQLGENQTEFGKHFGVSHAAVSDWESGKSEAPYKVLEWALLRSVREDKELREALSLPLKKEELPKVPLKPINVKEFTKLAKKVRKQFEE